MSHNLNDSYKENHQERKAFYNMIYNKKPTAKKGIRDGMFTKGSEWELVKDLNGYKTHEEGGVDLTIGRKGVFIHDGQSKYKAANGLLMPGPGDEVAPVTMSPEQRAAMAEQQRQSFLTYMQHPSYVQRLGRELYGEGYNPEDAKRKAQVDKEYARRTGSIQQIPIKEAEHPEANYYAVYQQEFDKNAYPELAAQFRMTSDPKSLEVDTAPHSVYMNVDKKYPEMTNNPELYKQVLGHELGHASHLAEVGYPYEGFTRSIFSSKSTNTKPDILMKELMDKEKMGTSIVNDSAFEKLPKFVQKFVLNRVRKTSGDEKVNDILAQKAALDAEYKAAQEKYGKDFKEEIHAPDIPEKMREYGDLTMMDHLRDNPTEIATRMIGLRRIAAEKFGHDMNEDFDIKKYGPLLEEYFKKNGMKNEVRELRQGAYTDDQINRIMKGIAQNTSPSQGTNEEYYG
jgi:hypothetical protein